MKRASFLFVAIASLSLGAAEAHAASRFRPADRLLRDDDSAAWLARNAHVLQSVEYPSPSEDLEPLRGIVRDARLVMLADATHGTHEFYTVKLRMIDFLVREMGFDVIAIEAPFAVSEKLNEYVQGGAVDVRLHLAHLHDGLYFRFWDVEELLDVLEWMRAWNANRGDRPPLTFAGFDISDAAASAREVVSYLESVDPEAADVERETYACITDERALDCRQRVEAARDRLAARRDELTALSDGRSYAEAMQHAVVVAQSFFVPGRDQFMADNVDWLRQNRGESGRMILWAHQEHAGRTESPWVFGGRSLGHYLSRRHGNEYVVIGTLAGRGSVRLWEQIGRTTEFRTLTKAIPPIEPGSYEERFTASEAPALLIPLRGVLPSWLEGPASFFTIGQIPGPDRLTDSLPANMDAVIFIQWTTPTRPLR